MRTLATLLAFVPLLGIVPARAQQAPPGPPLPDPRGFVNDFAGVLAPEDLGALEALTATLDRTTGAELAVAVVPSVAPLDSKSYAVALFRKWGVGKAGKDNGVLILLALQERRVEIEVGYGMEAALPDSLAGRLLDVHAVPRFREGAWGPGLLALAEAVAKVMSGAGPPPDTAALVAAIEAEQRAAAEAVERQQAMILFWVLFLCIGGPLLLVGSALAKRPWLIPVVVAATVAGWFLLDWIGGLLGMLLGTVAGWFTPRRDWAASVGSGGSSGGSGSRGSSSRSSSSSSSSGSSRSSGSSGGAGSSGRSFGGGRSGGGGSGRGF